jgi:lipoic acid synthetase
MVVAPEGRRLLRLETRNSQTAVEKKPPWIKARLRTGPEYLTLKDLVRRQGLHTVCEEAGCPNIFECWEDREATFLIGGDRCTRRCDFCQIGTGKPALLDTDEPRRVAVRGDGPADPSRRGRVRRGTPHPDFTGDEERLAPVFDARPEVLAHNLETVPRIFKHIRPAFRYQRSLEVLTRARAPAAVGAPPPGEALGHSGGVRGVGRGGILDRVRRGGCQARW